MHSTSWLDKSTAGRVAQQPPPPNSAPWQIGFYAACTKAVWLFRLAQCQHQTVTLSDNQAAVDLTGTERTISTDCSSHWSLTMNQQQHYCSWQTFWHLSWETSAHKQITWQGKSEYTHYLLSIISSNKQRWHRINICQHGPAPARWDSKQELNPLWCCWGKWVTRSILSPKSAFSPLGWNSIPMLNQDLRLHRPTCSLSN